MFKNARSYFVTRMMVVAKLENSFKDEKGNVIDYAEMTLSTGTVTIKANVMKYRADGTLNPAYDVAFAQWCNFEMQADTATGRNGNSNYTKYKINDILSDQEVADIFGLTLAQPKGTVQKDDKPFK